MNKEKKKRLEIQKQFIHSVKEQLSLMSEEEKDEWIVLQAKLLSGKRYDDFMLSLTGKKKIQYMPDYDKIEEFFKKIKAKEIYLEYETWYCEFDSDGRYYDDWDDSFIDRYHIVSFIDTLFAGIHDLILLEEYREALSLFEKIMELEIDIVESKNSEDGYFGEDPFTIETAYYHGLLNTDKKQVMSDYVFAYYMVNKKVDIKDLSKSIFEILEKNNYSNILLSDIFDALEHKQLLKEIYDILKLRIKENEEKISAMKGYSIQKCYLDTIIKYEYKMQEDIKSFLIDG